MEKGSDYLAKLIGNQKEFLISKSYTILGRDSNLHFKKDLNEYFPKIREKIDKNEIEKVNLGTDPRISKSAAIIRFNEAKKKYYITNISKNIIIIDEKILETFNTVKLKNKSSILIGSQVYFFALSKVFLLNYYKEKIAKITKKREKTSNGHPPSGNNNSVSPNGIIQNDIPIHKKSNIHRILLKGRFNLSKKNHADHGNDIPNGEKNKMNTVIKLESNVTNDLEMKANIDFDFAPPAYSSLKKNNSENILDDLINVSHNGKSKIQNVLRKAFNQ